MLSDDKPALLFYCQHSLGLGHLVRSFAIARALADRFRVVFLNGGPLPQGLHTPAGVERIDLPPLGMDADSQLFSRDAGCTTDLEQTKQARRQQLLDSLVRHAPRVLLIELFPFGRKKFAFELLPLLRAARRRSPRPLIVCSVRDLLVTSRRDQQRHDDRARWLAERYFDLVLVHADADFAQFKESFRPTKALRTPLYYTGFVRPEVSKSPSERCRRVLVSAGSGSVGAPLFHAAIDAFEHLWQDLQLPMKLIAGPFLPEADWQNLQRRADSWPGLQLKRHVPDLRTELAQSAASVSQCGYNTALDILQTATPALVVPFAVGREDEQLNRAQRLERLGLLRVLPPTPLSGERLAAAIRALLQFRPAAATLNLNGTANSARRIAELSSQTFTAGVGDQQTMSNTQLVSK